MNAKICRNIFRKSIAKYHLNDNNDQSNGNPYEANSIEYFLYLKNWTDTVQWHLEDTIRDSSMIPTDAVKIKKRIDQSNQFRSDMVEKIDEWFWKNFQNGQISPQAVMHSESPGLIIDRLSVLELKIYHMQEQTQRKDVDPLHIEQCNAKLLILREQQEDLSRCFDELLTDIKTKKKYFKIYRQMKMYNDPSLNPAIYLQKKQELKT